MRASTAAGSQFMKRTSSDQLPAYKHAVLTMYGEWYQPQRQGARGATPNPPQAAPVGVSQAQKRAKGRVGAVSTHVAFGDQRPWWRAWRPRRLVKGCTPVC